MQAKVTTLDSESVGMMELDDAIFGASVRADILNRVVKWQLATELHREASAFSHR